MKAKFILAIDPSGAFNEGKGTTGWCIGTDTGAIISVREIRATKFKTLQEYRQQHELLIQCVQDQYKDVHVVIEDYSLYKATARSHIGSHFETSQLIGILEHYCNTHNIPIFKQPASMVKSRWSNLVLIRKKVIVCINRTYYLKDSLEDANKKLSDHEIDSIRHYLHHLYFKNK